jgi:hypothetical protein
VHGCPVAGGRSDRAGPRPQRAVREGFSLGQYVNDRPYAASSMLAVAMSRVFKTAMTGRCDARPELAANPMPLEINVAVLPCRGGPDLARRLFEPLGWTVEATRSGWTRRFRRGGDSRYVGLRLTGDVRLAEARDVPHAGHPWPDGGGDSFVVAGPPSPSSPVSTAATARAGPARSCGFVCYPRP